MKKFLIFIIVNLFWTLLAAPAITAWLKDKEWASSASRILDYIYNFVVHLLGEAAFPWVSGTLLGITIGVFLHKLLIWAGAALSNTEKQFNKLKSLSTDVLIDINSRSGLSGSREPVDQLQANVQRLFSELVKLRVAIPNLTNPTQENSIDMVEAYINYISPFLEDRDITTLQSRAKQWLDNRS